MTTARMTSDPAVNRQWLLSRRPAGRLTDEDLEYRETSGTGPVLRAGEVRVRNLAFRCSPTMRNWMNPKFPNREFPTMSLGAPVRGSAAGIVVESANPDWRAGDRVQVLGSWQDHSVIDAGTIAHATRIPDGTTYLESLGRYGLNPMTAYFGLLEVGRPKAGELLVVSAAAGATGSVAAQLGKIHGMEVVGIAGGPDKCRWLTEVCGLDAAIDYKHENVAARLAELAPRGIDVYFDNVGGELLEAAVRNMARFGRIVLCGQISSYDSAERANGPQDMMRLIYGSIRMQGFLMTDYADRAQDAVRDLREWTERGRLIQREDVHDGFDSLPTAFKSLFDGTNDGGVLVAVDERARTAR